VKNRLFLANEKQSTYPPKEICWGPTIYCSKQNKKKQKTKVKTLHLIFADAEGVPRGYPQALMLVPLRYFLG
jgi:hypothetical protein